MGKNGRAVEPVHGEHPPGAQIINDTRHRDPWIVAEDIGIKAHMRRLALIVELLTQPLTDFRMDFARVYGPVHPAVNGKDHGELLQIGIHG